jgi:alkaline phosphatase
MQTVQGESTSLPTAAASPTQMASPTTIPTAAPTLPTKGGGTGSEGLARGIILFIGDGMGLQQRTAGRWLGVGVDGYLAMDQMEYAGWQSTGAFGAPITDSAAAATALASGHKTRNGYLSMDADGAVVGTILEQAKALGWATGLVTTVPIAHATPAAFAAHVDDRNDYQEIAAQMLAAGVDVLLGGGEDDWLPRGEPGCHPEASTRTDGRSLIAEAQAAGYTYVCDAAALAGIDTGSVSQLLGLFADEELSRPFNPTLAQMTGTAIEILSQDPDGFFLMVEGGQVDWAAHDNDPEGTMDSVLGLDTAVALGISFAEANGDLLLIVTADHETGGMSVYLDGTGSFLEDGPFLMPDGTEFFISWAGGGHTHVDVPLTASGPWAHWLEGHYENTFIYWVMHAALTGEAPQR